VNYPVVVHVPIRRIDSVESVLGIPITPPAGTTTAPPVGLQPLSTVPEAPTTTVGSVAHVYPRSSVNQISHYTVQRVIDVAAGVEGRDLGAVQSDVEGAIARLGPLPGGMKITVRGQGEVMIGSFRSLGLGLVLAVILVYLLMVVLYQSWVDPFIIIMAVPGALVGILWMLAITRTTLNVVSLMGSIMAVGIAVANSILLVSFANEIRAEKKLSALEGALEAGRTRLRPVLMTALAMIIGMLPMALGLGEGGEQNAPLGRAVIGGLIVATLTTLFIVPVIYTLFRRKPPISHRLDAKFETEARGETFVESDA
jgi:multidrug efflux pump subunit AcrB